MQEIKERIQIIAAVLKFKLRSIIHIESDGPEANVSFINILFIFNMHLMP